jgi:hypothetical protein
MRAFEFIIEGYKEAHAEFSANHANPEEVKDTISRYRHLVDRNQVQGDERNIDAWRKQGWDHFKRFVDQKSNEVSRSQIKRAKIPDAQAVTLRSDNEWHIVVPTNKAASCNIGSNTDWCTTKYNKPHYDEYTKDNGVVLIYCIRHDRKKWAIAIYPDHKTFEFFDQNDNTLSADEFFNQTNLNPTAIIQTALSNSQVQTFQAKNAELPFDVGVDKSIPMTYHEAIAYCQKLGTGWRLPTEEEATTFLNAVISGVIKIPINRCWIDDAYEEDNECAVAMIDSMQMIDVQYFNLTKKYPILPVRSKSSQ